MGSGLRSQTIFPTPDTSKSQKWKPSKANWNYSGSGRLGPIVIIKLSQPANRAGAWAWLSLATCRIAFDSINCWSLMESLYSVDEIYFNEIKFYLGHFR